MAEPLSEFVCDADGAPVAANRQGRWVHTEGLDPSVPEHVITVVVRAERERRVPEFISLKDAARDMLAHHVVGHPESDCLFAKNLREALSR